MANQTILQHWVVTQFILPFFLIFAIVFALLEKTKILGEGAKQLNAIVAFVIGMVFVGAVFPKVVVGNLILFLTVSIIIVFVGLLLWGFVTGGELKVPMDKGPLRWIFGIVIVVAVIGAVLWATGIWDGFYNTLFNQSWSSSLWTNVAFIAVVAGALAIILKTGKAASG